MKPRHRGELLSRTMIKTATGSIPEIKADTPLRLAVAAKITFPDRSITAEALKLSRSRTLIFRFHQAHVWIPPAAPSGPPIRHLLRPPNSAPARYRTRLLQFLAASDRASVRLANQHRSRVSERCAQSRRVSEVWPVQMRRKPDTRYGARTELDNAGPRQAVASRRRHAEVRPRRGLNPGWRGQFALLGSRSMALTSWAGA